LNDLDDLRGFGDDDFDGFDDNNDSLVLDDGTAARRGDFLGMSPVETLIVAVFVLLNIVALVMIILIATGRVNF
jgi:hypothetical protein